MHTDKNRSIQLLLNLKIFGFVLLAKLELIAIYLSNIKENISLILIVLLFRVWMNIIYRKPIFKTVKAVNKKLIEVFCFLFIAIEL